MQLKFILNIGDKYLLTWILGMFWSNKHFHNIITILVDAISMKLNRIIVQFFIIDYLHACILPNLKVHKKTTIAEQ